MKIKYSRDQKSLPNVLICNSMRKMCIYAILREKTANIYFNIWSKIPKIKYTISCQGFEDEGFKFPNFEIQVKSLQLNWIKSFLVQMKQSEKS